MTKTNAQNLSRRHVAAMPATKTIAKKVEQQPAPAQLKSTRDKIKSHKFSKDSNNLLKNECSKRPRPTYMSPQREKSYTPLRKQGAYSSPEKQEPYMNPLSDRFSPVGCFRQPFVGMAQFKQKLADEKRKFISDFRSEQLSQQLQSISVSAAPLQPASTVSVNQHVTIDTVAQPLDDSPMRGQNNFDYIKVVGVRAYICSICKYQVGEASLNTHRDISHPGLNWRRPGKPGRHAEGDQYENQYAHVLAGQQGLKWHQGPDKMYRLNSPYCVLNRELENGQLVGIRYRQFNAQYGDIMQAGAQDPGIDFAMKLHEQRFGNGAVFDSLMAAAATVEFDLSEKRFGLNNLGPLEDGADFGLHEESRENHIESAQALLNLELEEAISQHLMGVKKTESIETVYKNDQIPFVEGYLTSSAEKNGGYNPSDDEMM